MKNVHLQLRNLIGQHESTMDNSLLCIAHVHSVQWGGGGTYIYRKPWACCSRQLPLTIVIDLLCVAAMAVSMLVSCIGFISHLSCLCNSIIITQTIFCTLHISILPSLCFSPRWGDCGDCGEQCTATWGYLQDCGLIHGSTPDCS